MQHDFLPNSEPLVLIVKEALRCWVIFWGMIFAFPMGPLAQFFFSCFAVQGIVLFVFAHLLPTKINGLSIH